jgi:hypothetical protein
MAAARCFHCWGEMLPGHDDPAAIAEAQCYQGLAGVNTPMLQRVATGATKVDYGSCEYWSPELQDRAAMLLGSKWRWFFLPREGGGASMGGRRCSHGRAAVLQRVSGGGPMEGRRCFHEWAAELPMGGLLCYKRRRRWRCYKGAAIGREAVLRDPTCASPAGGGVLAGVMGDTVMARDTARRQSRNMTTKCGADRVHPRGQRKTIVSFVPFFDLTG